MSLKINQATKVLRMIHMHTHSSFPPTHKLNKHSRGEKEDPCARTHPHIIAAAVTANPKQDQVLPAFLADPEMLEKAESDCLFISLHAAKGKG